MDIHPILVHFPIALLTIYAFFECVRPRKLLALREWFYAKALFLLLGTAGAIAALSTGEFAEDLYRSQRNIIRVHSTFAGATTWIFGFLALLYLITVADDIFGASLRSSRHAALWQRVTNAKNALAAGPVIVPLAVIGFFALLITGALGGIIVYGSGADVLTQLVSKLILGQ